MNNYNVKICPCGTTRCMTIAGESNDERYNITLDGNENRNMLIPPQCNMGDHGIIRFTVCLNCGRIPGEWPAKQDIKLSKGYTDDSDSSDDSDDVTPEVDTCPQPTQYPTICISRDDENVTKYYEYRSKYSNKCRDTLQEELPAKQDIVLSAEYTDDSDNSDDSDSSDDNVTPEVQTYSLLIPSNKVLHVREYDREKRLYIDVQHNILIFSELMTMPIAVGYVLDGKITPLTKELTEIASSYHLPISCTHFDE